MARRVLLLFAIGLTGLTLVAAGCGGDEEESASEDVPALTETTEETTTEEEATEETTTEEEATEEEATEEESTEGDSTEDCQEFAEVGQKVSEGLSNPDNLSEVKAALDELAAGAPDEIKDDLEALADWVENPTSDPTAVTTASQNISDWALENCAGVTP